ARSKRGRKLCQYRRCPFFKCRSDRRRWLLPWLTINKTTRSEFQIVTESQARPTLVDCRCRHCVDRHRRFLTLAIYVEKVETVRFSPSNRMRHPSDQLRRPAKLPIETDSECQEGDEPEGRLVAND